MDIINLLYGNFEWITISALAKKINCSQRALKDDLAFFKEWESLFEIESSFKGIRIKFKQNQGLKSVHQAILSKSTAFQLIEYTLLNEHTSINELTDQLYISESTLYRLINNLNTVLKRNFDIEYSSNPFRLIGAEQKIRFFYYTYFSERYTKLEWPFTTIDEAALNDLLNLFVKVSNKSLTFASYANLKLIVTINLFRYRNNNFVSLPLDESNLKEIVSDLTPYQHALRPIEAELGITITFEALMELFNNYVRYGYSLTYERLIEKSNKDNTLHKSIVKLSNLIEALSEAHQIDIPNKEDIIWNVSNDAWCEGFEAKSRFILYDRNHRSVIRLSKHFPDFFSEMSNGLKEYRQLIPIPITDFTMDFIIYTFCSHWEKLIPTLQSKWAKIKLIIVSDLNNGHANLLKDVIDYSMGNQVDIVVYDSPLLTEERLKELGCEIAVANFPLPNFSGIHSVYTENVPSVRNLKVISGLIDRVNFEKNNRTYYMGV